MLHPDYKRVTAVRVDRQVKAESKYVSALHRYNDEIRLARQEYDNEMEAAEAAWRADIAAINEQ